RGEERTEQASQIPDIGDSGRFPVLDVAAYERERGNGGATEFEPRHEERPDESPMRFERGAPPAGEPFEARTSQSPEAVQSAPERVVAPYSAPAPMPYSAPPAASFGAPQPAPSAAPPAAAPAAPAASPAPLPPVAPVAASPPVASAPPPAPVIIAPAPAAAPAPVEHPSGSGSTP
ncbi:MAG TPA: hypothetical protein VMU00_07555, partial [Steroidobacteraceae bacterium]|nr:hypothetical protein [Steroidobacteraceae bacterium]